MNIQEPNLSALLEGITGFAGEGWAGLDGTAGPEATATQNYEAQLAKYERACMIRDGIRPEVLEWLLDATLRRATWPAQTAAGDVMSLLQAVPYGLHREGQNAVVVMILQEIAIANEGPPKPPATPVQPEETKSDGQ